MKAQRIVSGLALAIFLTANAAAADGSLEHIHSVLKDARTQGTAISASASARISESLAEALASDHRGLETGALRLVIAYGDVVSLNRTAVIEMVRLYRDDEDENVRQMAVVALGAAGDEWGLDFLERSEAFEDVRRIRHTIRAVLAQS
ncbi:MAG: hypothetical protein HKN29_15750 [Rhodothermales bacterium]|nr:hypothetical protein [Rhodothermales bacterium]